MKRRRLATAGARGKPRAAVQLFEVGGRLMLIGCQCFLLQGQLKLSRDGEYCLSQRGSGVGVEDVAEKGAAVASNSADSEAHGANKAVDGRSSTFWASLLRFCDYGPERVCVCL